MPDDALLPETLSVLRAAFGTDETAPVPATLTLDDVRRFLVSRITPLLDRNPAHLMSLLYRIDVAEDRVQEVLASAPPEAIPGALADLIIDRQLQKVRLRRRYREAGGGMEEGDL